MKNFFILIALLLSITCYGQEDKEESKNSLKSKIQGLTKDNDWIVSVGGTFSKSGTALDLGVITGAAVQDFGIVGVKFGSEIALNKHFYVAPKIGAEFSMVFFSARLSVINYTDFKYYEPKITPEIGFSILGYVNLTYGYNISITKKHIPNIPTNRFSITINIPLSKHPAP